MVSYSFVFVVRSFVLFNFVYVTFVKLVVRDLSYLVQLIKISRYVDSIFVVAGMGQSTTFSWIFSGAILCVHNSFEFVGPIAIIYGPIAIIYHTVMIHGM